MIHLDLDSQNQNLASSLINLTLKLFVIIHLHDPPVQYYLVELLALLFKVVL
jgi:hypothetical protein